MMLPHPPGIKAGAEIRFTLQQVARLHVAYHRNVMVQIDWDENTCKYVHMLYDADLDDPIELDKEVYELTRFLSEYTKLLYMDNGEQLDQIVDMFYLTR